MATAGSPPSWEQLPPRLQAAALHWAERWRARNTGDLTLVASEGSAPAAPPAATPGPACGACQQLLDALCQVGPPHEGWCDLRTQVLLGQADPATTMRHIFDTADPALLLKARAWVQAHG